MTTQPTVAEPKKLTAVRASWMFDGVDGTLIPDPLVVLDGSRIVAVGRAEAPPEDMQVVDLRGATLLPGLVDTHVHLCFDSGLDPVATLAARDDTVALEAMAAAARTALRGGVTTVRDLGDRGFLAVKLRDSGADDLPTILAAGPPITTGSGHCHFLGGAAERGPDGMRAAVRDRVAHGVDVIKIMASGGKMTPGTKPELAQFTREELAAAIDEAHRHGLLVAAHAHGTSAIVDVVAAGVDSIEHATFWSEEGVDDAPPEVMRAIVDRRIVVSYTFGMILAPDVPPPPEILLRLPLLLANARRLHEAGAIIVIGTDAGIAPIKPPDALRYAPANLLDLGFEPAEALRAVTSVAAEACGVGESKGRIAPGYDADLLAVHGDPLADPDALHRIRAVYARGNRIR